MKYPDKFFNKVDLPWVKLIWSQYYSNGKLLDHGMKDSSWWQSIMRLLDSYKGIAKVDSHSGSYKSIAKIDSHSGDTILFWHDL
jgi:hypothetical protein